MIRMWDVEVSWNTALRQTMVDYMGQEYIIVSTCDVSEKTHYPYETGIFHTDYWAQASFRGVEMQDNSYLIRGYDKEEALQNHINGIMLAVDYLQGRDV